MATPNVLYGTCVGTAPGGIHPFSLKLVLGETVNQQANTSVIPWVLYCFVNKSDYITGYHYSGNNMVTVQIGGLNVFPRQNVGDVRLGDGTQAGTHYENNPVLLASGTTSPIQHGDNGEKTITVYAKYEQASAAYLQSITISANVKLQSITRSATITSAPDISLTSASNVNHTITWTDVMEYYYKVQYLYGNTALHTSSLIAPDTETYTWAVPRSVAMEEPNSKTMNITVVLHTFTDSSGENELGSNSAKFVATMDSSFSPNITNTFQIDHDTVGFECVAGKSHSEINWQNNYVYGATFASGFAVYVDGNGNEIGSRVYGNATPVMLDVIPGFIDLSRSLSIKISTTDSRGFTDEEINTPFTVYGWIAPTIDNLTAIRCDGDEEPNERGNYFKVTFDYSIRTFGGTSASPVNDKNAKVKYKWLGENNYRQAASGALSDYSGTATLGPYQLQNPQDEKLEIRVEVSDALSSDNPTYSDFTILPADVFIDIMTAGARDDKKVALGVGIVADEADTIRSAWKLKMWDKPIEIYDDLGNLRAVLDYSTGVTFYDASGNVTKSYPVT